jgi:methyl acetate hydrolase
MMRRNSLWQAFMALGVAALPLGCGGSSEAPSMAAPGSLSPAPSAPATTAPPTPGDGVTAITAPLAAVLTAAVERGDAPGIVGLVVDRQGVVFEGAAGQLDVASGTAMPVDAIFTIASMTKPVTSVAAMILVERGQLGLDDAVAQFRPEFAGRQVITSFEPTTGTVATAPATVTLTVRHLLTHTSGLGYSFANATVARLQQTGLQDVQQPLLNEPGAEWHYSASTRVLGQIVEGVSGESLEAFFQENIFEPLGMVDTSFAVPAAKRSRIPTLHTRNAGGTLQEALQNAPATPNPPFAGDGGLYSTAGDYGRFMRMFLNRGELDGARVLSENSVTQMSQNQIGDIFVQRQVSTNTAISRDFPLGAGEDKFGLGFQITGRDSGGLSRSAGSLAWAGLFNTEFWIDPSAGLAATLLVQTLPFYDEGALAALAEFEGAVYRVLAPATDDD